MRSSQVLDRLKRVVTNKGIAIEIDSGTPPNEFFPLAWGDEPLTSEQVLSGTDIMFTLPHPDASRSHVANHEGKIIGQCSLNDTVTYWDHVNALDASAKNASTQTFVALHKRAAKIEAEHLESLNLDVNDSEHNAGIAVLPEFRGQGISRLMTEEQVKRSAERGKTTLFVETTNKYSYSVMKQMMFTPVAECTYKELAKEIGNADLNKLDDSFGVWCKSMKP